MSKIARLLRILTALTTAYLLCLLGWHCMDIYLEGRVSATLDAIFSYEDVAVRLKSLLIPFVIYVTLIVITGMLSSRSPTGKGTVKATHSHHAACMDAMLPDAKRHIVRWCILIAGLVSVLWGMTNGGLYDVLVKSINICTECIGLG